MDDALLVERDTRGVVRLTLNRPETHNAFDDALIAKLIAALAELAADGSVRALVIAANGRSFCAGADASWMRRMAGYDAAENIEDVAQLGNMLQLLAEFPRPTIARVQGAAYGGGVGLIACCDIAVASDAASFCLSEVMLGLVPATIGPYVAQAIGVRAFRSYALTAEVFLASDAKILGLVQAVSEPGALDMLVNVKLARILAGAPGAQAVVKQLAARIAAGHIDAALMQETARMIAERRVSPEGQAGLAAFLGKIAPPWQV